MKTKLVIYFLIVICFSITIYAEEKFGYSEIPNKIFDVPVCVGDINLKVYPTIVNGTYNLLNCTQTNESTQIWNCPCMTEVYLQIPNGTSNTFSITMEYYIKALVNNPLNDFNARRLVQLNNYVITEVSREQYQKQQEEIQQQNQDAVFFIIKTIFFCFLIIILVCLYFFYVKPKVRRSFKMDEDDKLNFITIIKLIFSRKTVQQHKQTTTIINKEQEYINEKAEIEARKILESINK